LHTMSRIMLGLVVAVVCLNSSLAVAGEPVNRDGQWGLFAGTGGLGLRYWTSDRLAFQLGTSFSWSKDSGLSDRKNAGASVGILPVFTVQGNLRFEGLVSLQYFRDHYENSGSTFHAEQTANSYVINAGLGVEYYFDELPRLTFGANLVGVSFQYMEEERTESNNGVSTTSTSYPKYFSTFSSASVGVTYYF
jgi:hypothetical protein